jgi:hypothetical protein
VDAVRRAGPRQQFGQRPLELQAAVVDHADDVGDLLDVGEDVGRQDHRLGVCESSDQIEHFTPSRRIQRRRRLVEQQDLGVAHQATGEAQPLEHPTGEAADPAIDRLLQAHLDKDVVDT